jgi:hypothetical protein
MATAECYTLVAYDLSMYYGIILRGVDWAKPYGKWLRNVLGSSLRHWAKQLAIVRICFREKAVRHRGWRTRPERSGI